VVGGPALAVGDRDAGRAEGVVERPPARRSQGDYFDDEDELE